MTSVHFRDFRKEDETPACGEPGPVTVEPDAVTCPTCRTVMPRILEKFAPPADPTSLEELLRRTFTEGFFPARKR